MIDYINEILKITGDKRSTISWNYGLDTTYVDIRWAQFNKNFTIRHAVSRQLLLEMTNPEEIIFKHILDKVKYEIGKNEYEAA